MDSDLDLDVGHLPNGGFDFEASMAEERRFVGQAASALRAIADDLDAQRLDHEELRQRLHDVTWPIQRQVDCSGHRADFLMRNALLWAAERTGTDVNLSDDGPLDHLAWALVRDGWWPRPGAWSEDSTIDDPVG